MFVLCTAHKPELELFLVSLSAEKVSIRVSMSPVSCSGNYQTSFYVLDSVALLKEIEPGHPETSESHGSSQPASSDCSKQQI